MIIDQLPSATPNLTDETVTEDGQSLFKTTWSAVKALLDAGVSEVNGQTGAVTLDADDVGAKAANAVVPITEGGTGATTAAGARANLGLALSAVAGPFQVAANSSLALTVGNNTRGILVSLGVASTVAGLWSLYVNAVGAATVLSLGTAPTSLTSTAGTNTVTFANTTTNRTAFVYAILFAGSITE